MPQPRPGFPGQPGFGAPPQQQQAQQQQGRGKRGGKNNQQQQDSGAPRTSYPPANPPTLNANGTAAWTYGQSSKGAGAPVDPRAAIAKGSPKGMAGGKGMPPMGGYGKGSEP